MSFFYVNFEDEDSQEEKEDSGSDEKNGRYDYAFVDPGPSDDQMCAICHLVARKPCQANCCGRIFCERCLEQHRQHSNEFKCPNCRKKLEGRYFRDIRIEREIFHLKSYGLIS